jgi:hypothetical protein
MDCTVEMTEDLPGKIESWDGTRINFATEELSTLPGLHQIQPRHPTVSALLHHNSIVANAHRS